MKNIVILSFIAALALLPVVGVVAQPDGFKLPTAGVGEGQVPDSGDAIIARIQTVANWVFAIFLAISLIYILLAAFQFVTGGGEPEQITAARQKLIYAAVGIALALLAAGFPVILRTIVTN